MILNLHIKTTVQKDHILLAPRVYIQVSLCFGNIRKWYDGAMMVTMVTYTTLPCSSTYLLQY